MAPITSLQNRRIKQAIKLRDRRGRMQQGRLVIDGAREILRAVAADVQVVELFTCGSMCRSDDSRQVLAAAADSNIEIVEVGELVFQKLAFGQRSEGVVAVAETPKRTLAQLEIPNDALIAIVENIEKPGNLGAIVRSADGAGVAAVVAVGGGTDLYNPAVIRASLGCVFALPVCWAGLDETIAWLRSRSVRIYAARVEAAIDYTTADFTGPVAIVLGGEVAGLSTAWQDEQVTPLRIAMQGIADSLNVSAAAAVLFYEARRQRTL